MLHVVVGGGGGGREGVKDERFTCDLSVWKHLPVRTNTTIKKRTTQYNRRIIRKRRRNNAGHIGMKVKAFDRNAACQSMKNMSGNILERMGMGGGGMGDGGWGMGGGGRCSFFVRIIRRETQNDSASADCSGLTGGHEHNEGDTQTQTQTQAQKKHPVGRSSSGSKYEALPSCVKNELHTVRYGTSHLLALASQLNFVGYFSARAVPSSEPF